MLTTSLSTVTRRAEQLLDYDIHTAEVTDAVCALACVKEKQRHLGLVSGQTLDIGHWALDSSLVVVETNQSS